MTTRQYIDVHKGNSGSSIYYSVWWNAQPIKLNIRFDIIRTQLESLIVHEISNALQVIGHQLGEMDFDMRPVRSPTDRMKISRSNQLQYTRVSFAVEDGSQSNLTHANPAFVNSAIETRLLQIQHAVERSITQIFRS